MYWDVSTNNSTLPFCPWPRPRGCGGPSPAWVWRRSWCPACPPHTCCVCLQELSDINSIPPDNNLTGYLTNWDTADWISTVPPWSWASGTVPPPSCRPYSRTQGGQQEAINNPDCISDVSSLSRPPPLLFVSSSLNVTIYCRLVPDCDPLPHLGTLCRDFNLIEAGQRPPGSQVTSVTILHFMYIPILNHGPWWVLSFGLMYALNI